MQHDADDECRRMTEAYRQGLGLVAVVAVAETDGVRIIALAADGEDSQTLESPQVRLWCRRQTEATCIAAAAAKILRRKPNGDATQAMRAAAKRLGVAVQTDADVTREAMIVAERIALETRKQQQAGALKSVNQAYRAYRLEASARGERTLRYDAWMQRYRENLVRQAAAMLRQF